ncbi:hypothetical protein Fmac_001588 [Flemingia macrophylla]|uniref:S-protein homolog n=1 Tax=Flemingia macrophylla TaxID=520843 RepID=A0ABD1NIB4_9FABA
MTMDVTNVGVKSLLSISIFFMIIFIASSESSNSLWHEILHPKLRVEITSRIPGVDVQVKCISSENDIKRGKNEIGQFLGFRSGSYCEKGWTWELYPNYALRISSRHGYVNETYKPIGSPDDHTYDYS